MTVGYLIGSHVSYAPALVMLLDSMDAIGIDRGHILIVVNGSGKEPPVDDGRHWRYSSEEKLTPFATFVNDGTVSSLGIEYWFFLNCTTRCGPRFKELVESGFDPLADATVAGGLLPLGSRGGTDGRAINDLAMYRYSYLINGKAKINGIYIDDLSWEGVFYAHAPKQAHYPVIGNEVTGPTDVYGTGTMRITEYYPGIDLYRFKKNWGNLRVGHYQLAAL